MGDPTSSRCGPPLDDDASAHPQAPDLIPDNLPVAELDQHSLTPPSSRLLLKQIRERRRRLSQQLRGPHSHPHPHHHAARPVVRLARRLSQHSLRQRETQHATEPHARTHMAWGSSPLIMPDDNLPGYGPGQGIMPIEASRSAVGKRSTFSTTSSLSMPPGPPIEKRSPAVRSREISDQRTGMSPPEAMMPSASDIQGPTPGQGSPQTIEYGVARLEVDSGDMEEDEGFSEGQDAFMIGGDIDTTLGSPRTCRRNGILRFRTSTEAAAKCTVVVRSVPRMRKRRQKKQETRLAAVAATKSSQDTHAQDDPIATGPDHI